MIQSRAITKDRFDYWWQHAADGLYILDEKYIEKAIVVISGDIVFEVIIDCDGNNDKLRTSYYVPKHDSSRLTEVSVEQFVDFLFESLPQYAEWFLFNPEWISK